MTPALIFDCDGVLADTERDGHLPAFNLTFADAGVPIHWSQEEYGHLLAIGGGKERLATVFTPVFVETAGLPTDPQEQKELVAAWHKTKTAHYTAMVADGVLPGRPGVARLVAEASAAGWRLAVASTSAEASVRAVLSHSVGENLASRFSVFAGDRVTAKKPAPDIYLLALAELGVDADDALVIEDSENGLRSALAAGLLTVTTVCRPAPSAACRPFALSSTTTASCGPSPSSRMASR